MISAKKAKEFSRGGGIYCGALSWYRNDIDKLISFAISDGKLDLFYESEELYKNKSELSKMIFSELENLGYTVSSEYASRGRYGISINWYYEKS